LVWTGANAKARSAGTLAQARCAGSRYFCAARRFDGTAAHLPQHGCASAVDPAKRQLRARVFDAVEQARVEAIGSRRMQGVAGNLDAMLDDRFHRAHYADIAVRAEAPLEDALAMIVRERLTGLRPPHNAQRIVDLWRPWIEERASAELDRLSLQIEDQRAFAVAVHKLLTALEMIDEGSLGNDPEEEK